MNINDILHSFHAPCVQSPLLDDVLRAMSSNDIPSLKILLTSDPELIAQPDFLQSFVEHFTPELANTLEQHGLDYMNLLSIAQKTEIGSHIWSRFLCNKNCNTEGVFKWALDGWYPSATPVYQTNASRALSMCFQKNSNRQATFLQHVVLLFPRLEISDRGDSVWNTTQWELLKGFSIEQWRACFSQQSNDVYVADTMMCSSSFNTLSNLYEIFQRLPECMAGLQQHYDAVDFTLSDLKQWATGEGLKSSPMYKNLPNAYQQDFFHDLEEIYLDGNSNIGVEHQRLMGLSAVDLFLRRFVRFENEDLAHFLTKTYPNFEMVFSHQSHLSVLHALSEEPKNLLKLDKTYGDDLAKCLDDSVFFEQLCEADIDLLDQIFTRFPQIVQWTDDKGNSWAHWYVVNRILDEKSAKLFHDHNLLSKPNHLGFVVRDIVVKDVEEYALDPHILSVLDRYVLMSHVDEGANTPVKRKI